MSINDISANRNAMLQNLLDDDDEFGKMSDYDESLSTVVGFHSLAAETEAELNRSEQINSGPAKRYHSNAAGIVLKAIDENIKLLRDRYPNGGRNAARVITSRILMWAPADFFTKYHDDVKSVVSSVATALADGAGAGSELIAAAYADPSNQKNVEAAYRVALPHIANFVSKTTWHGTERAILTAMVVDEIIGYGPIDPLWQDDGIDEIILYGHRDTKIEVRGRIRRVPSCAFRDTAHIEALAEKLFSRSGKKLSNMTPRIKGRMYDNSRIWGVHTTIAPYGPSINIRRHPEKYWTPEDMVKIGAASSEMMTDIGNMIWKGCSFLIVGGMSTGKTSMLNAFTGFFRPDALVITVEDSLELKPNPSKMLGAAMETVPARPDVETDRGVTMRDLVQSATQMRPDIIVLGEVTDGAAWDLCQALNLGRSGGSTYHANSPKAAIPRLLSMIGQAGMVSPEAALPLISSAFDFIVFLGHSLQDGSRRVMSVVEIPSTVSFDQEDKPFLDLRTLWEFQNVRIEDGKIAGEWVKVNEISEDLVESRGLDIVPDLSWDQIKMLSKIDPEDMEQ